MVDKCCDERRLDAASLNARLCKDGGAGFAVAD